MSKSSLPRMQSVLLIISIWAQCFSVSAQQTKPDSKTTKTFVKTSSPANQKIKTLDDLLTHVRSAGIAYDSEAKKREAEFVKKKDQQIKLLQEAREREQALIKRSETLEQKFEANENSITEHEETLRKRLGTTGEIFGIVRQVAGDTRAHIRESLVSAHLKGRENYLKELAQSKKLPSIDQMEKLWFALQEEMTESGKIVRFKADVVGLDGTTTQKQVVRIGTFNAVADGKYLRWLPELGKLAVLGRQPQARYLSTVSDFEAASKGMVNLAIDPSRGSILALLVQTPELRERIEQGGAIGYLIITMGIVTFILALFKMFHLFSVNLLVKKQQQAPEQISLNNPLGRVLSIFKETPDQKVSALERKLDEAILKESSRLDRFLWVVKVVAVIAPLLGLLGTVTGMIRTFQAIQLFGTGDPKMMAGGISEALVTTMLGLIVAVPLVLMHSGISSMVKRLVDVLQEQSAGIIAIVASNISIKQSTESKEYEI